MVRQTLILSNRLVLERLAAVNTRALDWKHRTCRPFLFTASSSPSYTASVDSLSLPKSVFIARQSQQTMFTDRQYPQNYLQFVITTVCAHSSSSSTPVHRLPLLTIPSQRPSSFTVHLCLHLSIMSEVR